MKNRIDLENHLMVLSVDTIATLLQDECPHEVIALYLFYHHYAKQCITTRPRFTINYVASSLRMGEHRVRAAAERLTEMGLIDEWMD